MKIRIEIDGLQVQAKGSERALVDIVRVVTAQRSSAVVYDMRYVELVVCAWTLQEMQGRLVQVGEPARLRTKAEVAGDMKRFDAQWLKAKESP